VKAAGAVGAELAHATRLAAPPFNANFCITAATIIPVPFLAIAVQGRAYQDLMEAVTAADRREHKPPGTEDGGPERERSPGMRGRGRHGRPGGWSWRRLLAVLITLILLAMIAGLAAGLAASLAH